MPETATTGSKRATSAAKPSAKGKVAAPQKTATKPRNVSTYDPAIARIICEQLSEGVPLRQICRENEGFPAWRTVYDWMSRDAELAARIAHARDVGYDRIAEECLEIADDATNDWMEKLDQKGNAVGWQLNGDHVQRSKLRIETRLKLLAKFNPKKYGDRVGVHGVEDAPAIKTEETSSGKLFELIRNMEMNKRMSGKSNT